MTGVPWYNTYNCKKLHGNYFEGFIRKSRTGRYNITSYFHSHEKEHQSYCDDDNSGGGCSLPSNSTTEALDFLGETIYFIGCWLKALEHNVLEICNMYFFNMKKIFQKTLVEITKTPVQRKNTNNYYMLLEVFGMWKKLGQKLPPLKKRRLRKKYGKEEDKIKRKLTEGNQYWNYWIFQIDWN